MHHQGDCQRAISQKTWHVWYGVQIFEETGQMGGGKGVVTNLKIYLQQMKKTKNTVVPCMFANFSKSLQLFSSFLANYNEIRGGLSLLLNTVKSNTLKIILYNKH